MQTIKMSSRSKKSKQQQRDDARKWAKGKKSSPLSSSKQSKPKKSSSSATMTTSQASGGGGGGGGGGNLKSNYSPPTAKQKLRAEAKDRAKKWARETLGKNNKNNTATVKKKKPMSATSKAEAKARARKWAKERFGDCDDNSDEYDDEEINSRFHRMGIAAYDYDDDYDGK